MQIYKTKRISAMFSKTFNTILTDMLNKMAILLKKSVCHFCNYNQGRRFAGHTVVANPYGQR